MAVCGFMVAFVVFDSAAIALSSNARGYSPASPLDAFLLLYYGEPEHAPSSRFYVTVPTTWLMGQALFFAYIACALFWANGGRGRQFLLRAGSSRVWWSSLCLAVLTMTLVRFLVSIAVCTAFPAVSFLLGIKPSVGGPFPIGSLGPSPWVAPHLCLLCLAATDSACPAPGFLVPLYGSVLVVRMRRGVFRPLVDRAGSFVLRRLEHARQKRDLLFRRPKPSSHRSVFLSSLRAALGNRRSQGDVARRAHVNTGHDQWSHMPSHIKKLARSCRANRGLLLSLLLISMIVVRYNQTGFARSLPAEPGRPP